MNICREKDVRYIQLHFAERALVLKLYTHVANKEVTKQMEDLGV